MGDPASPAEPRSATSGRAEIQTELSRDLGLVSALASIPEDVARYSDRPVIVVKRHSPVKALVGRVLTE